MPHYVNIASADWHTGISVVVLRQAQDKLSGWNETSFCFVF